MSKEQAVNGGNARRLWSEVLADHVGHTVSVSSAVGTDEREVPETPEPLNYLGFAVHCLTCGNQNLSGEWLHGGIGGIE